MNFFFFNDTATTEIYTLSLHDALPIFAHIADDRRDRAELAQRSRMRRQPDRYFEPPAVGVRPRGLQDDGPPATQLLCDPLTLLLARERQHILQVSSDHRLGRIAEEPFRRRVPGLHDALRRGGHDRVAGSSDNRGQVLGPSSCEEEFPLVRAPV